MAVALAVLLVSAGCSTKSPLAGDLVWAVAANDVLPATDIAAMWHREHPTAPAVRVEELPRSSDDQHRLLAIELNAKLRHFDVLSLDVVWTGEFAENGWIISLQDLRSVIEPVALPGPFQSATWQGTLWAAPFMSNAGFLYYRTDLVDRAPTSWEDIVRMGVEASRAEAARGHTVVPFVGQGAQYEGLVVNYLEYLWGAGGDLFDAKGTRVRFDREAALKALDFMRSSTQAGAEGRPPFYHPQFSSMTEDEALAAFRNGEAVFMRNWPDKYVNLNSPGSRVRGVFDIAALPTFEGRTTSAGNASTSALGGLNLAVSRWSTRTEAAKQFVRFASTSPQVQHYLARNARPPTLRSVYAELSGDPVMKLLGEVLPAANPRPPVPQWSAISDELQQQVFAAYTGQKDTGRAVDEIRGFLERTVADK